jgi:voltage-gated potassium channel
MATVTLRRRVHEILEVVAPEDRAARLVNAFILGLIVANVAALILETVEPVYQLAPRAFRAFEVASVAIFSIEYLFRLWSCVEDPRFARPVAGRLRFVFTPMALVDLCSILPFYLPLVRVDARFVRALRLLRLFRIAKLGRYSTALQTLGRVARAKKEELVAALSLLVLLLVISSTLVYHAEHSAQPDKFSSIPAAMWWGIVTLATVGYGDVCPVTAIGKILGGVIAVLGIGLFALPTGILGAGFMDDLQRRRAEEAGAAKPAPGSSQVCPHCGKEISSAPSPSSE